ncbi:Putative protein [Zobellia galactanivorans]|uniref:Uncharacterized protein n=1 Tax=Zobellia galactanivorans (strain DSM 12802 / CCUG 47099 / CIP 106680 / NCIMB 13871 / Dsij) TaxID=63186 RepID=G0L9H4_ZOBGA|nr:Putative protein [Zobellia galactanivorans]
MAKQSLAPFLSLHNGQFLCQTEKTTAKLFL